jgi:hypothetical protein
VHEIPILYVASYKEFQEFEEIVNIASDGAAHDNLTYSLMAMVFILSKRYGKGGIVIFPIMHASHTRKCQKEDFEHLLLPLILHTSDLC